MRRKLRAFLARQRAKLPHVDTRAFVWRVLGGVRKSVALLRKPKS